MSMVSMRIQLAGTKSLSPGQGISSIVWPPVVVLPLANGKPKQMQPGYPNNTDYLAVSHVEVAYLGQKPLPLIVMIGFLTQAEFD